MDLTEEKDIKRWQEYTEELYKKGLNEPDNHDGVVTGSHSSGVWTQAGPRKQYSKQS